MEHRKETKEIIAVSLAQPKLVEETHNTYGRNQKALTTTHITSKSVSHTLKRMTYGKHNTNETLH